MAGVHTSTSAATHRPPPSAVGTNCWVTTPCRAEPSWIRIWSCWFGGKTSMMRSMVEGASWVWRVAKTKWPVSAAVSAVEMVSRSRKLADQDDVGVLPQDSAKGLGEREGVCPDFALADH